MPILENRMALPVTLTDQLLARQGKNHATTGDTYIGTLKIEMLQGGCFLNESNARTEIFAYIEGYYNTRRKHSSLDYQTPHQFEAQIFLPN